MKFLQFIIYVVLSFMLISKGINEINCIKHSIKKSLIHDIEFNLKNLFGVKSTKANRNRNTHSNQLVTNVGKSINKLLSRNSRSHTNRKNWAPQSGPVIRVTNLYPFIGTKEYTKPCPPGYSDVTSLNLDSPRVNLNQHYNSNTVIYLCQKKVDISKPLQYVHELKVIATTSDKEIKILKNQSISKQYKCTEPNLKQGVSVDNFISVCWKDSDVPGTSEYRNAIADVGIYISNKKDREPCEDRSPGHRISVGGHGDKNFEIKSFSETKRYKCNCQDINQGLGQDKEMHLCFLTSELNDPLEDQKE